MAWLQLKEKKLLFATPKIKVMAKHECNIACEIGWFLANVIGAHLFQLFIVLSAELYLSPMKICLYYCQKMWNLQGAVVRL